MSLSQDDVSADCVTIVRSHKLPYMFKTQATWHLRDSHQEIENHTARCETVWKLTHKGHLPAGNSREDHFVLVFFDMEQKLSCHFTAKSKLLMFNNLSAS